MYKIIFSKIVEKKIVVVVLLRSSRREVSRCACTVVASVINQ